MRKDPIRPEASDEELDQEFQSLGSSWQDLAKDATDKEKLYLALLCRARLDIMYLERGLNYLIEYSNENGDGDTAEMAENLLTGNLIII